LQRTAFLLLSLAALSALASPPVAKAQSDAAASVQYSPASTVRLEHTTHPLATPANAVGRVESSRKLERMLLVLATPASQEEQLAALLDAQQNPRSPNYHRWLSAKEFGAQFGASDADVQDVRAWLEGAGFTVSAVSAGKRWLEFSGTAAQVESAFQTQMQYYGVRRKTYLANATDLAVPAELSGIVRGVASLNNFGRTATVHEVSYNSATSASYVTPSDFAAIYNTKPLLSSGVDGTGAAVAVVSQSQIKLADAQQLRQIFQLKANHPNVLLSGPDPGVATEPDADEALLNVEWVGAVAPGATIDLVVAGSTDTTSGIDLAATYAVDNRVAPILVYSYGSCEQALGSAGNAFYNALWRQAAAEGMTVLVAAGDSGVAGCDDPSAGAPAALGPAVNGVASTPYNVAVGGTEFVGSTNLAGYSNSTNGDYSSAIGYLPEATWNESCDPAQTASASNCALGNRNFSLLAAAGGPSTIYAKPVWQAGAGVPADGMRDLPDVALAAASARGGYVFCSSLVADGCQTDAQGELANPTLVPDTSVSTPAMAGILALIEQKNGVFQGQVNPVLYRLAQIQGNSCDSSNQTNPTASTACVFYDITSGNNSVPCAGSSPGCSSKTSEVSGELQGYSAGPGYDLATGLGSLNAANLAAAWSEGKAPVPEQSTGSFTVSANSISFTAGSPGNATVTITPSGGFSGSVALACPTGGTSLPAGYNCAFGSSTVQVGGGAPTTTALNLTLASTTSSAVKVAHTEQRSGALWAAIPSAAVLLMFGFLGMASGEPRAGRNFLLFSGLLLGVLSGVTACGGGGGSSGGQVSTTTTISSSNLRAAYGTPVTFSITVTPNGSATPSGFVELIDNGQTLGAPTKVSAGIASFLAASLPVGVHTITAQYLGDSTTLGSTSAPITQLTTGTVALQISGTSGDITATSNFSVTLM
jgi:subtilase family serine protease